MIQRTGNKTTDDRVLLAAIRRLNRFDPAWRDFLPIPPCRDELRYDSPSDLWTSSGWPAATYGWERGIGDAIIRIEQLTRTFGK